MTVNCKVNCPIVGWARVAHCPTCSENPANASRREDICRDADFAFRELGPYDREPEYAEYEKAFGGEE